MCSIITELLFHLFNIERLQKKAKVNTVTDAITSGTSAMLCTFCGNPGGGGFVISFST